VAQKGLFLPMMTMFKNYELFMDTRQRRNL
jgi:hypothetical protein